VKQISTTPRQTHALETCIKSEKGREKEFQCDRLVGINHISLESRTCFHFVGREKVLGSIVYDDDGMLQNAMQRMKEGTSRS